MAPGFQGPGGSWAGGPSTAVKSYASALQEREALISSYEHLSDMPAPNEALHRLRKIASLVKPIMRKRDWKVTVLTEFMPEDPRLLGLNINHGYKICVRLRYSHAPGTFIPIEQTVDTMLHELSHIVFGPHDANFHALWDELRNEHETLLMKGYTGEGFLTEGHQLGGGRVPPPHEIRRLARASAEKRNVLNKGSGTKVGGRRLRPGADPRQAIVRAIERRNKIDQGCASGSVDAGKLANQATQKTFKTKGEEDDANDRAIAQALFDLLEEEENRKLEGTYATAGSSGGLTWTKEGGLASSNDAQIPRSTERIMTEEEQMEWALQESMKATAAASPKKEPKPDFPAVGLTNRRLSNQHNDQPVSRQVQDAIAKSNKRPRPPSDSPEIKYKPAALNGVDRRPSTLPHELSDLATALSAANPPAVLDSWTCEICTFINPLQYLACDACGIERPATALPQRSKGTAVASRSKEQSSNRDRSNGSSVRPQGRSNGLPNLRPSSRTYLSSADVPSRPPPKTMAWRCVRCGTFMEHQWWSCSQCGSMKATS